MENFHQTRSMDGLQIICLGNDFNTYTCEQWAGLGASFPILDDRATEMWRLFGNGSVPRNVIIDSQGKVHYTSLGYDEPRITEILGMLLTTQSVDPVSVPTSAKLVTSYPNPFNAGTQIEFHLDQPQTVTITIYDSNGRPLKTLYQGDRSAGTHTLNWLGNSDGGESLASGVYHVQLRTSESIDSQKILYLK